MDLGSIFLASLVMGFSGAIMPGPLLTVTINESLRRGFIAGPLIVLGHAILELFLVCLLLLGFGTILDQPLIKGLIGLVGGSFLIWMAYGMMQEARRKDLDLSLNSTQTEKTMNPVFLGATISASNPYWSLWWATVGTGSLILAGKNGFVGSISFYLGHIFSDLIWYSLVSWAIATGRRVFTPVIYRMILWVCGFFLIGLALYFIYSGINFFRG
jgi:threonine/homoserine/homoserine lactone efflux protein